MSDQNLDKQDLLTLVAGIAHDTGSLVNQHIELLRADLSAEARRAGAGVVSIVAGGGMAAAGGLLSGMMVAHLVNRTTRLPLWACFGLVGGGLVTAGLKLMQHGGQQIASVQLLPPRDTAAALQEDAAWLKAQTSN